MADPCLTGDEGAGYQPGIGRAPRAARPPPPPPPPPPAPVPSSTHTHRPILVTRPRDSREDRDSLRQATPGRYRRGARSARAPRTPCFTFILNTIPKGAGGLHAVGASIALLGILAGRLLTAWNLQNGRSRRRRALLCASFRDRRFGRLRRRRRCLWSHLGRRSVHEDERLACRRFRTSSALQVHRLNLRLPPAGV